MRKKSQGKNQNEQMKSNNIGKAVLAWKNIPCIENSSNTSKKIEMKNFCIYYLESNM